MARSIPEWRAKHDDQAIPARVKLRVLDRQRPSPGEAPICGCGCGQPIRDGDAVEFDHLAELADGGEHRENNLRALIGKHHKLKSARVALERARGRRNQKKAYGIAKSKNPVPGSRNTKFKRRMDGTVVNRETGEIV